VEKLTNILHACPTTGYLYSSSPYYKAPFFIILKTPHNLKSNFLSFEEFYLPNMEESVLCMLQFNDDIDRFTAVFSPNLILHLNNTELFHTMLEFWIVDSSKNKVQVADLSQLYLSINIS
jgi:hypothetical protein